jgi:hypothetical protein
MYERYSLYNCHVRNVRVQNAVQTVLACIKYHTWAGVAVIEVAE